MRRGKMSRRKHHLIGRRFGALVAQSEIKIGRRLFVVCLCDCGNLKSVRADHLVDGSTSRCCKKVAKRKVGKPRSRRLPNQSTEYRTWGDMWTRCRNPNAASFKYYGARGITVCDRWKSFDNFYADMGSRPSGKHSIDRIDNDGNYEPGNCRWATLAVQNSNKRKRATP